jgi:hypothetical protein
VAAGPLATGTPAVELRIPWADLGVAAGDPFALAVVARDAEGAVLDLVPDSGAPDAALELFPDPADFVAVTWEVDATGAEVPLAAYGALCHLPSDGARVGIAGDVTALGLAASGRWIPNRVWLRDDGQPPDEVAGDDRWAIATDLRRGRTVRWKYTIGLASDEGRWLCTEEFPIALRAWTVTTRPDVAAVRIREVFADRPPEGTAWAPRSTRTCLDATGVAVTPCE